VIARPLRSVVLLAATGLAISSCATAASNHHASTTTTTVTTTSTEIKEACTNQVATPSLLGSLVAADGRSGAVTVHGSCSTGPAAASTTRQRSLRRRRARRPRECGIPGSRCLPEFFERAGQSPWRVVGSAPPPGVMDCATFKDLPSRLRSFGVTASSRQAPPHNTRPLVRDPYGGRLHPGPVGRCHRERHRDR